jgi:tRNA pseudouridine38-40 synthase
MRYFIRLRYKGTTYHGWQIQNNAHTVQESVDKALSLALRCTIETLGCGRTDSGVHADDFYAHFDLEHAIEDTQLLLNKLEAMKIPGIQFRSIHLVHVHAHARFDAIQRTYEYRISLERNPFLDGMVHYLKADSKQGRLDIVAMNTAAKELYGKQDFSAFSKSNTQVFTNNCDIVKAVWEEKNGLLIFTISADRFLRNMVRAIVGTLLEIGQGKRTIEEMKSVIESKSRSDAGMSVPASGLFLTEIKYPDSFQLEPNSSNS